MKQLLFIMLLSITGQGYASLDQSKSSEACGACHQRIYNEYKDSLMGKDLVNEKVYQFYTGTNPAGKKDGLGYQGMHPGKAGDCADCHVPTLVLNEHKKGNEVDLGVAMRDKTDHGISCNYCHSITDVNIKKDNNGRYKTRVFDTVTLDDGDTQYGPGLVNGGSGKSVHKSAKRKLFKESEICATCHLNQEKFLSISQYDDWKTAFDSGKTDQTCQECHMPLLEGKQELAIGIPKVEGMRAHTFIGAHDLGMLKKTLSLELDTEIKDGKLIVKTTVENIGAGHKVPGSGPIRNVILKLEVTEPNGEKLVYTGDKRGLLPPLAGFGNPKTKKRDINDWAGMPGKMYAKVYKSKPIPKMGNKPMVGVGGFAADSILFDTTLDPKEPDHAKFSFKLPKSASKIEVRAKIVYRDAFKPLSDRKGWKLQQRPMISKSTVVQVK